MTEELLKFSQEKLLFVDIETASGEKEIDVKSDLFKAFQWKMRNKETDALLCYEEAYNLYQQKAALFAPYLQIVAITLGYIKEQDGKDTIIVKTFSGEEKVLLQEFVDTVNSLRGYTVVAWNVPFDLPMIRKRFILNGLKGYLRNDVGNDSMKKPWTITTLDLMDVWKGVSYSNESMDEVAIAMGLPSPKDDIKGSDVSRVFHEGGIERIIKYNQKDVITLVNLYRKFTYQDAIENIVIRENTETREAMLMEDIYMEGTVSPKNEVILLNIVKDFSEKEKQITIEILEAFLYDKDINPILIEKIQKAC